MKTKPYSPSGIFDKVLLLRTVIDSKQTIKPGIISILVLTSVVFASVGIACAFDGTRFAHDKGIRHVGNYVICR